MGKNGRERSKERRERKRDFGRKGERERKRDCGRERGIEVAAVMVKTTAHL